jgi:hypothetical protein
LKSWRTLPVTKKRSNRPIWCCATRPVFSIDFRIFAGRKVLSLTVQSR